MDLDREIDAELRELFTSDRLDVPVRPDAENVIVAGARRVRRRRIATATASGVVAAVAMVVAGIVLASGDPDAMPPATTKPPVPSQTSVTTVASPPIVPPAAEPTVTSSSTSRKTTSTRKSTSTATSTPPPKLNFQVLGPAGFRSLALGQTLEEAQATGLVGETLSKSSNGCANYELLLDDRATGWVEISDTVQAIGVNPAQTPEGVGPGWTIEQVKTVYPALDTTAAAAEGIAFVPVPGNGQANYRLRFIDGEVDGVILQADGLTCGD